MCGIVAYKIHRKGGSSSAQSSVVPILLDGMQRLAYRGYDSAGMAYLDDKGDLCVYKKEGKVDVLSAHMSFSAHISSIGMGHTRWATHGSPSDTNAHPHVSYSGDLAMVHNGIIENYTLLKKRLIDNGYDFKSETDSEILISFIDFIWKSSGSSLEEAVRYGLSQVIGSYALVLMVRGRPDLMIAASNGSPVVIGDCGDGSYYMASDVSALLPHTNTVVYLEEGHMAVVLGDKITYKDLSNVEHFPKVHVVDMDMSEVEKGDYAHFMLKEICMQPEVLVDCMRGRLGLKEHEVNMRDILGHEEVLKGLRRIILIGCGTSWHACLIGEYVIEELCRMSVEVEYASEFRYRDPVLEKGDLVLVISQSGETADTLAAVNLAKQKGVPVWSLVNVVRSSISRATEVSMYLHAGPEIGVASTKAFTTQITILVIFALHLATTQGRIKASQRHALIGALRTLPEKVKKILDRREQIETIAKRYQGARNFLYLGRGLNFPVALEGALKLKEISYIHAEGYPAAEMKHGPIALIDEEMPVVFLATKDSSYEKVISNIEEVKSRKGQIIAVVTERDKQIAEHAQHIIEIPRTHSLLTPVLSVVPLQLLAYYIANARGCDVDQPRNLAKSVTVE